MDGQHSDISKECAYLLRRSRLCAERGDAAAGRDFLERFHASFASLLEKRQSARIDLLDCLFAADEHQMILDLFHMEQGGRRGSGRTAPGVEQGAEQNTGQNAGPGDTLAGMVSAIHFMRGEPDLARAAAGRISDPEQRRLREKTAELWPDLVRPLDAEPRAHLLVLAHNRQGYAGAALRQLAATDYRNYALFVLDNGSSDGTLAEIREAVADFPAQVPVSVEALPTNIGRPAGHNWLLCAHDHSAAEYIAIGDDDLVRVPPDWLRRMVRTAKAFPGCGCVGGQAISPGWPARVHGSCHRLLSFGPERVTLSNTGEHESRGQFDFVDMVDHVIGCLHLFDRAALERTGHFDISLSPAQFVDVEHHLRMRLAGFSIIYNGLIRFEHLRTMGRKANRTRADIGNALGNMLKLLHKHERDEAMALAASGIKARSEWLGLGGEQAFEPAQAKEAS